MRRQVRASENASSAIRAIGRTEDVQFSPSNSRLAIAGLLENAILILNYRSPSGHGVVELSAPVLIQSSCLKHPHGLSWIDDATMAVANRGGEVAIIRVPPPASAGDFRVRVAALQLIRTDEVDRLHTPGSVSTRHVAPGLLELLVCNNYANKVSSHLLADGDGYEILASETLLSDGLRVPDGIAHSASSEWIAVSNHYEHAVNIYRNDASLNLGSSPVGIARGVDFPHGVRFSRDDTVLLVADAGAPFVHVFSRPTGNWSGGQTPFASLRVIDEEAFARGHKNPEEGGPKGIDVSRDGLTLVVSCEEEPIAFYDISGMDIPEPTMRSASSPMAAIHPQDVLVLRLIAARRELGLLRRELSLAQESADQQKSLAQSLLQSSSWRLTRPLRWLKTRLSKATRSEFR